MKIYHNPRCSKSRQALKILQETAGENIQVVKYLETPPGRSELKEIIKLLDIEPEELVRKTETIYKEHYKGKEMSGEEWIDAMVEHPKLIQRPVVVQGNRAVIGRPPENVRKLLQE